MTGFGTYEATPPAKRTLMSVTLPDMLPSDERAWLDTLAERYAHDITGAHITQAAPNMQRIAWRVSYDEGQSREPTATFTYTHAPEGLIGHFNATRARFLESTIEGALYELFGPGAEAPPFEVSLEEHGMFAARMRIPDDIRSVLGSADAYHATVNGIVRSRGGSRFMAELHYGPLTLENLQYRNQPRAMLNPTP